MKKYIHILTVAIAVAIVSCGEEIKTESNKSESNKETKVEAEEAVIEKSKYDESSPDFKMATILCGCFESFNEEDPDAQLDAIGCFMEGMSDPDVQNSNEDGTMKILEDVCPESHANFSIWKEKMKNVN